jgi:hypothetical protein
MLGGSSPVGVDLAKAAEPRQPLATSRAMRVAIVSTPRSGNTWLRHLLARVYGATERAFHSPAEIPWADLPDACILQLHWSPTPSLRTLLEQNHFRVVVLARHPLDVLLSILHFALFDPSTDHWLVGEGGSEASTYGAMPCSPAFVQYATSRRAKALLSVSLDWWDLPEVCQIRYENLVADSHGELSRVVEEFGVAPVEKLDKALTATTFSRLRARSGSQEIPELSHHYWQGRPGHWKRLLTSDVARTIAAGHAYLFDALDYDCDPDPTLDRYRADANWIELTRPELMERLLNYGALKEQCAMLKAQVAACRQPLAVRVYRKLFGRRSVLS